MGYLVNLVLDGRPAVVIGGGTIASRKVEDLLAAGALVTVVAVEPCARIRELAAEKRIAAHWRPYTSGDLRGAHVAVAATGDAVVNAQVYQDAQALGVLVNVVDRPALCTFTLLAVVRRGPLTIAVSTDGLCPAFSSVLREELEAHYGGEYAELTRLMGDLRRRMIALGWEGPRIREAVAQLYRDGIAEALAAGDRARMKELVLSRLGPEFDHE